MGTGKKPTLRICAVLLLAVAFSGCAGFRISVPDDPLVLLGDEAALYAVLPVAPNRGLLVRAVENVEGLGDKERESAREIIERTDFVRFGLYGDQTAALVLSGDFPRAAAPFVFPESKGWKKVKGTAGASWYEAGRVSAAIPVSGTVCVTLGSDMDTMLSRAKAAPYPPVSETVAALSASRLSEEIAFSLLQPALFLPSVLGSGMNLPVTRIDGYCSPDKGGASYTVGLSFSAPDERQAKALAALLKLLSGRNTETAGFVVSLETGATTVETLAGFTGFLLF